MFFNEELRRLALAKERVALRCELRRRLLPIEMQSMRIAFGQAVGRISRNMANGRAALVLYREWRRLARKREREDSHE